MHIDRTRTAAAKARTVSRRVERRRKSTALFLAYVFPPMGDTFGALARVER